MAHIRRQREHMATDLIATLGARGESAHRKGMAELHSGGAGSAGLTREASGRHHRVEGVGHGRVRQRATAVRDTQVRRPPSDLPTPIEVVL